MSQQQQLTADVEQREVMIQIKVPLEDVEVAAMAHEVAGIARNLQSVEAEFDDTKREFKNKIEGLESQRDNLLATIRENEKTVSIEAIEVKDFAENRVRYYGVVPEGEQMPLLKERDMEAHERQQVMDLENRADPDAA